MPRTYEHEEVRKTNISFYFIRSIAKKHILSYSKGKQQFDSNHTTAPVVIRGRNAADGMADEEEKGTNTNSGRRGPRESRMPGRQKDLTREQKLRRKTWNQ
jgi:predicted GNAT family acetyltransferase